MNTFAIRHPDGRSHTVCVRIQTDGKVYLRLDDGQDVPQRVGRDTDWGNGNTTPSVVPIVEFYTVRGKNGNPDQHLANLRVEFFQGWKTEEGNNYIVFDAIQPGPVLGDVEEHSDVSTVAA